MTNSKGSKVVKSSEVGTYVKATVEEGMTDEQWSLFGPHRQDAIEDMRHLGVRGVRQHLSVLNL